MNKFFCLAVVAAAGLAASTRTHADDFEVDGAHTSVVFKISHLGFSNTYGLFNEVKGNFVMQAGKPEATAFQVTINAESINTGNAKRDQHLRAADFLNAGEYPTIAFKSTSAKPRQTDDGIILDVTGELTLHGVTKTITLPMKKLGEGPSPMGDFRVGFDCQTTIKRSDFGMTKMLPGIGDEIGVMISFEGVRKQAAAAATGARPRTAAAR